MSANATTTRPNTRKRNQPVTVQLEGMPAIYSNEAEQCVLGAMLSDPENVIPQVMESGLQGEDFFVPAHQEIFSALVQLKERGTAVDPSTLMQYLTDHKLNEAVGGPAILGDLSAGVVSVLSAPAHIKTVREKSLLRHLQGACGQIVFNVHERQHEVTQVLDEAERLIFGITDRSSVRSITSAKYVIDSVVGHILNNLEFKAQGVYNGVPSGFIDLDRLTTGFKGGEMIVIAARPGMGKTALALSMVKNMLRTRWDYEQQKFVEPGFSVGMFSLEMTNQQLLLRLLAATSNLSLQKIREGNLTQADIAGIQQVTQVIGGYPLYLDESSDLSISQLRGKARRMKQMYDIDIIVIDYLQLLTSSSDKARDNRQVEVAEISRGIKALAVELNIPVIVLAQLNRKSDEGNAEPALHHLRESGSIEQDADLVLLLSRAETKDDDEDNKYSTVAVGNNYAIRCKLNIAKQRNGPTDSIELAFLKEYTRFESMPKGK